MKELQGNTDSSEGLEKELKAVKEEFEAFKKSVGGGEGEGVEGEGGDKDKEIAELKAKLAKTETDNLAEMKELKQEYFRACAIGIVQQRKITKVCIVCVRV